MPLSSYDAQFGGKKGAAAEAHAAMVKQYGLKRGNSIFYATVNARKKKRRGKTLSKALRG